MSILFLDIDGVLNSIESAKRGCVRDGTWWLDPVLVQRLGKVIDATDPRVVLSSTWRRLYSLEEMRGYLEEAGLATWHCSRLCSTTPIHVDGFRGREIAEWRAARPQLASEPWAIVDDDADMLPGQPLVQTDVSIGLTDEDSYTLIQLLKGEKT